MGIGLTCDASGFRRGFRGSCHTVFRDSVENIRLQVRVAKYHPGPKLRTSGKVPRSSEPPVRDTDVQRLCKSSVILFQCRLLGD